MKRAALRDVELLPIRQIAEQCQDPLGLDYYLRQFWVYVPDPVWTEYVRGPELELWIASQIGRYIGDCDDAATFAACVSVVMGWPCWFVAYRLPGRTEYSHVNLRCMSGGYSFDVDPTVPAERLPIRDAEETMEVCLCT